MEFGNDTREQTQRTFVLVVQRLSQRYINRSPY